MSGLKVFGTEGLKGEISVHGSKNAVLPILAASILCKGTSVIKSPPRISDVFTTIDILKFLGCSVKWENNDIIVNALHITENNIPAYMSEGIRSSITFLGALTGRTGKAEVAYPGGCLIGERPVDLHLYALRKLNIRINEHDKTIVSYAKKIIGNDIVFPFPSVGATQNAIMAATVADGITNIYNGAREPEVEMLIGFLNSMGADIKSDTHRITIKGVKSLHGCRYESVVTV